MPARHYPLFVIAMLGMSIPAQAQTPASNSNAPLEITADGTLEWHRNESQFVARENAKAKQGDVAVSAKTLTAKYDSGSEGANFDISEVFADTDVILESKDSTAHGQKARYDLKTGYAEMTGENLRLVAPDQTVTAKERFEYWVTEGKLIAIGDATILRKNEKGEINTLKSDRLTAYLKDDAQGKRALDRLEAEGSVTIKTPTETLTGTKGIYNAATNIAEIEGQVKIMRGPNILEGARADVDMNTGISRIFGSPQGRQRVRGVFYPGSEQKR